MMHPLVCTPPNTLQFPEAHFSPSYTFCCLLSICFNLHFPFPTTLQFIAKRQQSFLFFPSSLADTLLSHLASPILFYKVTHRLSLLLSSQHPTPKFPTPVMMHDSTSQIYNCSKTLTSKLGALAMHILILFTVDFPLCTTCFPSHPDLPPLSKSCFGILFPFLPLSSLCLPTTIFQPYSISLPS